MRKTVQRKVSLECDNVRIGFRVEQEQPGQKRRMQPSKPEDLAANRNESFAASQLHSFTTPIGRLGAAQLDTLAVSTGCKSASSFSGHRSVLSGGVQGFPLSGGFCSLPNVSRRALAGNWALGRSDVTGCRQIGPAVSAMFNC